LGEFSSVDFELLVAAVVVGVASDADVCLEGVCLALRDILGNKKTVAMAVEAMRFCRSLLDRLNSSSLLLAS
jgi:hypothetical protein